MSGKATNPNAICAHCGNPFHVHFQEDRIYCFRDTNGDTWSTEPNNEAIGYMIEQRHPELYALYAADWQRANGHTAPATPPGQRE